MSVSRVIVIFGIGFTLKLLSVKGTASVGEYVMRRSATAASKRERAS